jgi:LysM repeat protein
MITLNRRFILLSFAVMGALIVSLVGMMPSVAAQTACGSTYIVQSGDTLSEIAQTCETTINAITRANPNLEDPSLIFSGDSLLLPGAVTIDPATGQQIYIVEPLDNLSQIAVDFGVSLDALIAANPGISNPSLIFTGQRIRIPMSSPGIPITGGAPDIQLSQAAGPAGQVIYVSGDNFPANVGVNINLGEQDTPVDPLLAFNTGNDGRFTVAVTIPSDAELNSTWVIQAYTEAAGGIVTSAFFDVQAPAAGRLYTIRPGDTLNEIALRFNTTLSALLQANPNIIDPNLIYTGQLIEIPS